jgi:two-component system, sensor histidine kinase and response regulator
MVAKKMLGKINATLDIANNGQECLNFLDKVSYDVILMDCQMPVMDGYEATLKIRERTDKAKDTVIIAMTAQALREDRAKCIDHGMNDYLAKPVTLNCLLEKLLLWSGEKEPEKITPSSEKKLDISTSNVTSVILDMKIIQSVVEINETEAEGRMFLIELLDIYQSTTPEIIEHLRRAVTNGEHDVLYKLFHKAKGASANIGARTMAVFCNEMEQKCKTAVPDDIGARIDRMEILYTQTMESFVEYLNGPQTKIAAAM